jgi:ABC-type multidrug transport system fused ATPase/permease subunit
MDHLLLLDLTWHEKENSGKKLKRIQKGGEGIDTVIRIWFDHIIQIVVNFLGMVFIIATFDLAVAAWTLVFLVTYFIISYFFTKYAGNSAHIVNIGEEDLQGVAFETINNIRSVKVLGMRHGLLEIIKQKIDDLFYKIKTRIGWFRSRAAVLNIWAQIFRLSLTFFIAWGIIQGHYELGFLVLFITYFNYVWESIDRLSNVILDFVVAKYGVSRMMDILKSLLLLTKMRGRETSPRTGKRYLSRISLSLMEKEKYLRMCPSIFHGERRLVL